MKSRRIAGLFLNPRNILCPGGYSQVRTDRPGPAGRALLPATRVLQQRTRRLRRKLTRIGLDMDVRISAMTVILVAAVALSPCAKAQTSGGEVLTLDKAIQLARSNNRDLKQTGLDIGKQRQAVGTAKAELYPRLDTSVLAAQLLTPIDFTLKAGQLGTYPATEPIPGSNTDLHTSARPIAIASVTATQPLTQLFRIRLFVSEQQLKVQRGTVILRRTRTETNRRRSSTLFMRFSNRRARMNPNNRW
jgi:cell division protein FtsL